jgi:hypothetical protein
MRRSSASSITTPSTPTPNAANSTPRQNIGKVLDTSSRRGMIVTAK